MAKYKILIASLSGLSGRDFRQGEIIDGSRLANIDAHLAAKDIEEAKDEPKKPETPLIPDATKPQ